MQSARQLGWVGGSSFRAGATFAEVIADRTGIWITFTRDEGCSCAWEQPYTNAQAGYGGSEAALAQNGQSVAQRVQFALVGFL